MGGRGGFGGSGGVRVEWGAGIRSVRVGQILPKKFCLAGKVLLCYAIERKKRLVFYKTAGAAIGPDSPDGKMRERILYEI